MLHVKFRTLSLALVLALTTMSVQAQQGKGKGGDKPTPEKMAEQRTEKMDKELNLTDEQEAKVYAINLKYAEQNNKQRENAKPERGEDCDKESRPNRQEMQKKMQEQQEAYSSEVMDVLDQEQKVKYADMLKNQKKESRDKKSRK